MKHPVYWFLVSSGLLASTSLSFAQLVKENLNSSNSYNGNKTTDAFQPKTTSTGAEYTCVGNVCITYAGKGTALTTSCFSDTAEGLTFIGQGYSLCFDNITATTKPAAIEVSTNDKTLSITGFSLFSCSYCPPGTTGQGAIQSKGATTFSNNNKIIFEKNCSTGKGGAIKCDTGPAADLKIEGNKYVLFSGNSSQESGGAIFAKKFALTSGGTTIFSNNAVSKDADPKGGAICLDDTGSECSLTAQNGDIIFDGNKVITTTGTPSTKRNSIDLGSGGKFTQLRAKDGFGVFFYDPIANNGDTNTEIEINKADGAATYSGRIVFSGEKLTEDERKEPDNLKSVFKQPLKIGSGSLILKDGVTVEAKQITQTAGSAVVMDTGTTLQTPSTNGETITLPDLTINIASFGGGGGYLFAC